MEVPVPSGFVPIMEVPVPSGFVPIVPPRLNGADSNDAQATGIPDSQPLQRETPVHGFQPSGSAGRGLGSVNVNGNENHPEEQIGARTLPHTESLGNNGGDRSSSKSELKHSGDLKRVPSLKLSGTLKAMMGNNEELERINVKATLDKMDRWPVIKKGYAQLFTWLVFFGLYCAVMILQLTPGPSFRVDGPLRNQVANEGDLSDLSKYGLNGQGDFFTYLNDQIMPNVFPDSWYNNDPYTTNETGYLLDYNRLVGGLLIVQGRGDSRPCAEPYFNGSFSSYEGFYPVCYSETPIEDAIPKKLRNGTINSVPWAPGVPAPPKAVNDTRTTPGLLKLYEAFTFSDQYGGFACWLAEADGTKANQVKIDALKTYRWLDKFTRTVDIKFAVYNGYFNMFSFVKVSWTYSPTGAWIAFGRKGGIRVKVRTINMEPYRIGPDQPAADAVRLALEVILMVWIFDYISSFLREGFETFTKEGWHGKAKKSRGKGTVTVGGLKRFLTDPWTLIDMINYALFIAFIAQRVTTLQSILNENNIIRVPTNKYHEILENVANQIQVQLYINFFNVLLCLIRCFKFFRFQPRLAIINKTLSYAFPDLYHFMLMFVTVLFGFAVMSHVLFGPICWQFSTIEESINTAWLWMLGSFDYAEVSYVDGPMAAVYFIFFVLIMQVVLLNVLLAILVDAYAAATDATLKEYDDDQDKVPSLLSDFYILSSHFWTIIGSKKCPDETLTQALLKLEEAEVEFCTAAQVLDVIPALIRDTQQLDKDMILANSSVVVEEIDADEEKFKQNQKAVDTLFNEFANSDAPLSRQDKMEMMMLQQIDELIRENILLKYMYGESLKNSMDKKNN